MPEESADPVISTYNSFAAGIVREFGALLGRDFTADVLSEVGSSSTRPTHVDVLFRLMLDTFSHDCGVECYGTALSGCVFGYP